MQNSVALKQTETVAVDAREERRQRIIARMHQLSSGPANDSEEAPAAWIVGQFPTSWIVGQFPTSWIVGQFPTQKD